MSNSTSEIATQRILDRDLGAGDILHLQTNNARLWSVIKSMMRKAYDEGYEKGDLDGWDNGYENGLGKK